MDPATKVWLLFGVVSAGTGLLAELCIRGIALIVNRLRTWAWLPDEEGGIDYLGRAKFSNGHIIVGKGTTAKRYPFRAESKRMTNLGPMYVIGRNTGANLAVPGTEAIRQTMNENELVAFDVVDPMLLAKAFAKNQAQSTVEGQMEPESWWKSAQWPVAIVGGIAVTGLVIVALKFAA